MIQRPHTYAEAVKNRATSHTEAQSRSDLPTINIGDKVRVQDPQTNKWSKVSSMCTRRLGVGVAVLGGFVYAVGGSDGTSPLNTGTAVAKKTVKFNYKDISTGFKTTENCLLNKCSRALGLG